MLSEFAAVVELSAGSLLSLYPANVKPLEGRLQQLVSLAVCVGCSLLLGREARAKDWEWLVFAIAYCVITTASFFLPMIIVVATGFTTSMAVLTLAPGYVSLPVSLVLAIGMFALPNFARHWQVWLLPGLAALLVQDGLLRLNLQSGLSPAALLGAVYATGCVLQLNKLKRNYDALHKEAEVYKENHYKLFEEGNAAILAACKGDQEQIERILFGAGLY